MKDYVIINGVSSQTKTGLAVNILPPITKPKMRTLIEEIDGRDGDLITKLGYSAYDKTIEIGLFGNGYDVDDIVSFFNKEGTITFSNEPTKYYNFTLIDSFDIERLLQFKTSTITFHCQPFKYLIDEEPKEIEYQYVTGEGTEITLNNTKNVLMELELKPSELTQETTTGKNLAKSTFDSKLYLTGSGDNRTVENADNYCSQIVKVKPSTTYTCSGTFTSMPNSMIRIAYFDNIPVASSVSTKFVFGGSPLTFTTGATTNYILLYNSQYDTNTVINDLQLEEGSSATQFEPYTGGIPQPNPDYPSEVQVIKGNNNIKIWNKNYFDKNNLSQYGFTGTVDTDGAIIYNWLNNFTNSIRVRGFKENTQYTFSYEGKKSGTNASVAFVNVYYTDGTISDARLSGLTTTYQTKTFTTSPNKTIDNILFYNGTNGNTYAWKLNLDTLMITEGTELGDYVAHQEQVLPLNLPVENLFDKSVATANKRLGTQGELLSDNDYSSSDYIKIKPSTTYSYSRNSAGGQYSAIAYYDSNKTFISRTLPLIVASATSGNRTSPQNAEYCRICDLTPLIETMQLEEGSKANQYTPYGTTPIEYCKIGNYEDEFEHDGDKWYLNKYIDKVALGDLSYTRTVMGSGNILFTFQSSYYGSYSKVCVKCSHFLGVSDSAGNVLNSIRRTLSANSYIVTSDNTDTASTTAFKTWLTNNNVNAYFIRTTPTHEEITDATLISQLNAIEQAVSYDKQTNILQTNAGLPFRIKATAMIAGSDEVEINNNGNIYANPILDIKGSGVINVYLDGTQMFSVDITDEIIVDIPNLEAYNPNTSALMNRNVTGDIGNFIIPIGTHKIAVDGAVDTVTITYYKRWL